MQVSTRPSSPQRVAPTVQALLQQAPSTQVCEGAQNVVSCQSVQPSACCTQVTTLLSVHCTAPTAQLVGHGSQMPSLQMLSRSQVSPSRSEEHTSELQS